MLRIYLVFVFVLCSYGFVNATSSSVANTTSAKAQSSVAASTTTSSAPKITSTSSSAETAIVSQQQTSTSLDCYSVGIEGKEKTVVCAIKPSTTASTVISILALIISLGGLLYTLRKDKKARLQSIEDDFWIRKVISPIAMEPLIKKVTETSFIIPEDMRSGLFDKDLCNQFGTKFQSEWNQIAGTIDVLALLDKNVCIKAKNHVSNIEDEVLRYCSNNVHGKIGLDGGCINKPDLQAYLNTEMIAIMECIKHYQLSKI